MSVCIKLDTCELQRNVQRQLASTMCILVCCSSSEYLKRCFNCEFKAWRIQVTDLLIHVFVQKKSLQFYSHVQIKKTKLDSVKSDQLSSSHPYWRTLVASMFYPLDGRLSNSSHFPWAGGAWCVPNVLYNICECCSGLLEKTQLSCAPAYSFYKVVSI